MRKLVAVLALALATGACAGTSHSSSNGWTTEQLSEFREGFYSTYGKVDAYGECALNYVFANYTPDAALDAGSDQLISEITSACG